MGSNTVLYQLFLLFLLFHTIPVSAQQKLHYEETFDNNTNGWAVWDNQWNSARFEKGSYLYDMKGNYSHQTWNNYIRFDVQRDFAIETKFSLLKGNPGESSFWLEWDIANGGKDYYAFGIYSDGTFQYGKAVNQKWIAITNKPVAHAAIQSGLRTNILRMERSGSSLVLRVNGEEVYRTVFESIKSNTATGFQLNGPQLLAVDYLKIFQDPAKSNQPVNLVAGNQLFPVLKSLDKDLPVKNGYLFTGAVEGNAENGRGVYLEVYLERWDDMKAKLKYKIFKGDFAQQSVYFNGTIYYAEFMISRKNTRKNFEPESGTVDLSMPEKNCTTGESGEMKLTGTGGVRAYNLNGQATGKTIRLNNTNVYTHNYFHNNEPVYSYQKDNAGNQFWGLVGYSFEKIAGYELKADGTIYIGGFSDNQYFGPGRRMINGKTEEGIWNRGGLIATQAVYIPDTLLLKKAAKNIAGNLPFAINIDPLNADEYLENSFGGRFYKENGEETSGIQQGNGLVFGYNHECYFGQFKNGKADGIGFFAVPRWGENNYARSTNVYGGYFEQGKFMVGPVVHKTRNVTVGRDIMQLVSTMSSDPNFKEERDFFRTGNYYKVLTGLRDKAQKGVSNASSMAAKFNETFTNNADFYVNKPTTAELQKAMDLYFSGKPSDAVNILSTAAAKGDAEAGYYLAGFYEKGIGVLEHHGKADSIYRQSVQGGYNRAAMPLARKYLRIYDDLMKYGVSFPVVEDDSAMKYYLIVAQSQPASDISPAEIQEARIGYYAAKYYSLRNAININIRLGDDTDPNTPFGSIVASDRANKQRQQDITTALRTGKEKVTGKYFENISSHLLLYVQSSNDNSYMVPVVYLNYDQSKNTSASMSVNELQNQGKYREVNIKDAKACSSCKGEGVIKTSYKRTVADYEYTLGVKVVQSGSNSSGCISCGGSGMQIK